MRISIPAICRRLGAYLSPPLLFRGGAGGSCDASHRSRSEPSHRHRHHPNPSSEEEGLPLGPSAQQGFKFLRRSAQQGDALPTRSVQKGFTPLARSAEHGFTLLEMLVALVIFSLAALALVRLQGVSVRTAADLDQRTLAQIVARNLAYERMTDPETPSEGETEGTVENAGRTWHWVQGAKATMGGRLMGITIRVDSGPGQSPAVMSFVKAVPVAGSVQ